MVHPTKLVLHVGVNPAEVFLPVNPVLGHAFDEARVGLVLLLKCQMVLVRCLPPVRYLDPHVLAVDVKLLP